MERQAIARAGRNHADAARAAPSFGNTFADNWPGTVTLRKLADTIHDSPRIAAQRKLAEAMQDSPRITAQRALSDSMSAATTQRVMGAKALAVDGTLHNNSPEDRKGLSREIVSPDASPVQMVKIRSEIPLGGEYMNLETNGATVELLESWLEGVHPADQDKLEFAIATAKSLGLYERAEIIPSPKPASVDNSGLRYRGPKLPTPESSLYKPQPAAKTKFETIHGQTAHGAPSYASTAGGFVAGLVNPLAAFDINALKNAGSDTLTSAKRTTNEFGRGEYTNAMISSGQTVLSGVQTVLSTPVSHVASHMASLAMGSPVPLLAGDAIWYPANSAKEKLDNLRTPKVKTE